MEYKYRKILRQYSILAVNFWNVTYFGVFNIDTSYLGAKIGQSKTMTKISRFTHMETIFRPNINVIILHNVLEK